MKQIRKTALFSTLSLVGLIVGLWAFVYGPVWYVVNVPTHPAIDETRVGLIKELKKHGYVSGKTLDIDIESEGGNLISIQLIEDSKASKLNKIHVAIGTDIARSVKETMSPEAFLVFSSVTDPVGAGLIKKTEKPEGRVTGVSNFVSTYPQLKFFYTLYPKMKRIGFLYNPNELNSMYVLHDVQASAAKLGLEVVLGEVTAPSAVEAVARNMMNIDAFYVNNDNTVSSEWGDVVHCRRAKNTCLFFRRCTHKIWRISCIWC
jgi:putative tryptophan/tyrosine transport system substrate-binding protein